MPCPPKLLFFIKNVHLNFTVYYMYLYGTAPLKKNVQQISWREVKPSGVYRNTRRCILEVKPKGLE